MKKAEVLKNRIVNLKQKLLMQLKKRKYKNKSKKGLNCNNRNKFENKDNYK
jgi:hypothetical protein